MSRDRMAGGAGEPEEREPRFAWEHLMLLIRGQDAWRRWREGESGGTFEAFARAHPDEAREIREALEEWNHATPRPAWLAGADLSDTYLYRADFLEAHLEGAKLQNAHLVEASLIQAHLAGADLRGADLRRADVFDTVLEGADLRGADLTGAHLKGADLTGADLRGARLDGVDLGEARVRWARFGSEEEGPG